MCMFLADCLPACLPACLSVCQCICALIYLRVFLCCEFSVIVQASQRNTTPRVCVLCSIYIHPSLILCVREMGIALCAWRTITKTHGKEFISHSLTHSRWSTPYVHVIHTDISKLSERGWISQSKSIFWGRAFSFFRLFVRILPNVLVYVCSIRRR